MRAACVFGHVAADAAHRLRGRVGRIEIAGGSDPSGHVQVDDAGLDDHARVGEVNFKNAIHARQADDDAISNRQRPAA